MENDIATVVRNDARTLIYVRGEIDVANCADLHAVIEPELARSVPVVVDLAEVTYMDSACINVLLRARILQDEHGGTFTVQNPTPTARRLFTLTGLEHLMGE